MKIKRNKRVEQNLKMRVARKSGKGYQPVLSWHRLRASLGVASRKPKSLMTLLEQDLAARTERVQLLEKAIAEEFEQAELALVPVLEPISDVPVIEPVEEPPVSEVESESVSEAAGGRTNYQYVQGSQRVRRRIIL